MMPDSSRFLQYILEEMRRTEVEEPTHTAAFRQVYALPDDPDLHAAPIPGGVMGSVRRFVPWIRARYPDEADAELQPYYEAFGVTDDAALLEKLRQARDHWPSRGDTGSPRGRDVVNKVKCSWICIG
jgi:hypothetical protein